MPGRPRGAGEARGFGRIGGVRRGALGSPRGQGSGGRGSCRAANWRGLGVEPRPPGGPRTGLGSGWNLALPGDRELARAQGGTSPSRRTANWRGLGVEPRPPGDRELAYSDGKGLMTKDQGPRTRHRLLFASIHSYLDPSSGAALATRELLELLAARGWDCRAFTCGVLDYAQETPLDDVLAAVDRPVPRVGAALSRGGEAEVFDLELGGVRITLLPTSHSRADKAPDRARGAAVSRPGRPGARAVPARRDAHVRRASRLPGIDASGARAGHRRGVPPAQLRLR